MWPPIKWYPKELVIGDAIYQVKFMRKLDDPKNVGECCPSEKIIFIKQGLDPRERFQTLVHELFHAFEFEYEFKLDHRHVYKLERAVADLWESLYDEFY